MKNKDRAAINEGLKTHHQESDYKDDEFNQSFLRYSNKERIHNQIIFESFELFEKFSKEFRSAITEKTHRNGIIQTDNIPLVGRVERYSLTRNNFYENIKIGYYYGKDYDSESLYAIVYCLEFYPFRNAGMAFIEAIKESDEFESLKRIYYDAPSITRIGNNTIEKKISIGLEDPFWDEYSTIKDTNMNIEMQTIRDSFKPLIELYRKYHEVALQLDYKLSNGVIPISQEPKSRKSIIY